MTTLFSNVNQPLKASASSTAFLLPLILAAAYLSAGQSSCNPPTYTRTGGTNLAGVGPSSTQLPFVNVMKQASSWVACDFEANPFFCNDTPSVTVSVDSHGNPTAIPPTGLEGQAVKSPVWTIDPSLKEHTPIQAMDWVFMIDGELLGDMFEFTCQGSCGTGPGGAPLYPGNTAHWSTTSGGGHKITLSIDGQTAEGNFRIVG